MSNVIRTLSFYALILLVPIAGKSEPPGLRRLDIKSLNSPAADAIRNSGALTLMPPKGCPDNGTDHSSNSYLYQNFSDPHASLSIPHGYNFAPNDKPGKGPSHCYLKFCRQLGQVPSTLTMKASIDTNPIDDGYGRNSASQLRYDVDVYVTNATAKADWKNVWSVTGQTGKCQWVDGVSGLAGGCGTSTPDISMAGQDNIMVCARVTEDTGVASFPMIITWNH